MSRLRRAVPTENTLAHTLAIATMLFIVLIALGVGHSTQASMPLMQCGAQGCSNQAAH
jgi:hypothetical protein